MGAQLQSHFDSQICRIPVQGYVLTLLCCFIIMLLNTRKLRNADFIECQTHVAIMLSLYLLLRYLIPLCLSKQVSRNVISVYSKSLLLWKTKCYLTYYWPILIPCFRRYDRNFKWENIIHISLQCCDLLNAYFLYRPKQKTEI